MQKSFIEKLNDANYGKRGIYIAAGTFAVILLVKLFVTPTLEPRFGEPFWVALRRTVEIVETLVMLNLFAFFISIIAFKEKIGHKIIYAMQLKDTSYFKDKWVLFWIKSIWISFGVLAVTTVIKQSLFKSWSSFFFLIAMLCIPFFIMPRLRRRL